MKRVLISIFCFCLFSLSLNCQPAETSPKVTVPIQITDNRPFVEVMIKDKIFYFVVDTGGFNLIDLDAAKSLDLKLTEQTQTGGTGEETVDTWTTKLDSFFIGERNFKKWKFYVLSIKNIKEGLKLPYLDGVIGYDLFRNSIIQIDYPKKTFSILPSFEGKNGIPFTLFGSHIPKIKVEIDGIESEFILDTGDRSQLTLSKKFSQKLIEQNKYQLSEEKITGHGIGGPIQAKTFDLKSLKFGNVSEENVLTRVPTLTRGAFAEDNFYGSIGSGILKKYRVTIDYRKRLIYFD